MATAYLCVRMIVVRDIPRFRDVRIFSSQASSIAAHIADEFYMDLLHMDGETYDEAEKRMRTWIHSPSFPYKWVKKFIYTTESGIFDNVHSDIRLHAAIDEEEHPLNIALEHMGEIPHG